MPKAANAHGGMFENLEKPNDDKPPGPGFYFKDRNEKTFVKEARGGTFSKLSREWGRNADKTPAAGQYETMTAQRTRGGLMSRRDRVCAFVKIAEKMNTWHPGGPGKYDAKKTEKHTRVPNFTSPRTESRNGDKPTQVGPGYYNPSYVQTDVKPPSYSSSKESSGTFMNKIHNDKDKIPFPWYKDMPESKVHDKIGSRKHCAKLMNDRELPPRVFPAAAVRQAMGSMPRQRIPQGPTKAEAASTLRQTPRDGRQTPRDGRQTPRDGRQTPRDGRQTPRDPAPVERPLSRLETVVQGES